MVAGDTPAQDKIDKKQFEYLCGLMCTEKEISAFFEVDIDTLVTWCKKTYGMTFSDIFNIKKELGNVSLRRNMQKMSETIPSVAIFLAKNRLGMKDKSDDVSELKTPIVNIQMIDQGSLEKALYDETN